MACIELKTASLSSLRGGDTFLKAVDTAPNLEKFKYSSKHGNDDPSTLVDYK